MYKIIGIAGLAGDGKDSVCNILESFFKKNSGFTFRRVALAVELKLDSKHAIIDILGIDPTNCPREDKEKIRPFLVFYGKLMRLKTKGQYWTNILDKKFSAYYSNKNIFCVPDVRYVEYPDDEVQWVKKNSGVLIHVKKYTMTESLFPQKVYTTPVNKEELQNDPKIQQVADYLIEWQDSKTSPENDLNCILAVESIAKKILKTI